MTQTANADGPASIVIQRRVELTDTDASKVWHNSAALRFMEAAQLALLARLGFVEDVFERHPPVRIEADFLRPLWFGELVDVELTVEAVGRTSVRYAWEFRRGDTVCAQGRTVAVLLDRIGGEPLEWSQEQRDALLSGGPQAPERLS